MKNGNGNGNEIGNGKSNGNGNDYSDFRDYVYKELDQEDEEENAGENEDEDEFFDEDEFDDADADVPLSPPLPVDPPPNPNISYEGRQIVSRTININSQYRDLTKYPTSTDFSVDLSEKLKNVISLRMNSIQVPFTWYTINKYYGSNFFFIKCTAVGMNLGQYDYKIQVSPGNYTCIDLVQRLQQSLEENKLFYSDVTFGNTSVEYNGASAKLTIKVDITHVYNETNYEIEFPSQSNYVEYYQKYGNNVVSSLHQLLGYKYLTYRPYCIYSSQHANKYDADQSYTLTSTNSTIYVYLYQGSESDEMGHISEHAAVGDVVYTTLTIQLTLGTFAASDIILDLEKQIRYHPSLNTENSFVKFIDQTFTISINVNRKKVFNGKNVKSVLLFPEENGVGNPIWRGISSLF
jgi:hypothetical protein